MPVSRPPQRTRKATSADHVLDVLLSFRTATEPLSVTEISRRLGLPSSSVHRALVTLHDGGYLERRPGAAAYQVGVRVHELVHTLFNRFAIRGASRPYLRRLAASLGETVALSVRIGWYSVRITGIEGWRDLHRPLRLGETWPLHIGSSSRVILAFQPDAVIEEYLANRPFARYTARTLHTPDEVWRDVRTTRERGYALGLADVYAEARTIGFPVRDGSGRALAAVTISGAAVQFDPQPGDPRIEHWKAVVAELEALVQSQPERFRHPLPHVDPDALSSFVAQPPPSVPALGD
jgi:IclR family acetate operon transcriptional repressor